MSELTFTELQEANQRRNLELTSNQFWGLSDWLVELCEETGEVAADIKRLNRLKIPKFKRGMSKEEIKTKKKELKANLQQELADVAIVVGLLANEINIDLGEAIKEKFNEKSDKWGCETKL